MRPRIKVWVVFGKGTKFGDGRAELLRLVERYGSLQQAVSRLGMSYRNAWGYLRELERAAGFKLLERPPGRGPAAGMRLSAAGRRFLRRYDRFRTALERTLPRLFAKSFRRRP